jgi:ADP-ribose pyrophosphatase YjhB (NUDIX family)
VSEGPAPFLVRVRCVAEDRAVWPGGIELVVHAYLIDAMPPLDLVTSARCVVLRGDEVLVFSDGAGPHVLPGGRLEPGETPEHALRRELLEETGWRVGPLALLGCIHLRHLTARPDGYAYPYPDFFQVIYTAQSDTYHADGLTRDQLVQSVAFLPVAAARSLPLPPIERAFLDAALAVRA